jgi:hypothetical protein
MADMTPSEAMKIMENPSDHTVQERKDAKAVLRKYSVVTARDKTTGDPKGVKAQMMRGGMANKKVHMYSAGGNVTDNLNPGLRALKKERPDVVAKMLKK